MDDNTGNIVGGNNASNAIVQQNMTFEFPIHPPEDDALMKNIPHSALPIFRGSTSKDDDVFLFEFDVLCNSYDYQSDAQKLKLFPATLKDVSLQWFMSLRDIWAWDQMKDAFLEKCQEYCKTKEVQDEIFCMTQREEESTEDFLEYFFFSLECSRCLDLTTDAIKILFLRGIQDETMDALNLIGKGHFSKLFFEEICDICRNYL